MSNFRSHVVNGPDTLRVSTSAADRDEFRKANVADFDVTVFGVDVGRFEVAVDNASFVQEVDSGRQTAEQFRNLIVRQTVGILRENLIERLASDVFHDDPVVAVAFADVEDRHDVRVA